MSWFPSNRNRPTETTMSNIDSQRSKTRPSRRVMVKATLAGTLALARDLSPASNGFACAREARSSVRLPKLYRVPLGMETGRLHEMEPGYDDGRLWFWAGGIGATLLEYDPRFGTTTRHTLSTGDHPEGQSALGQHFYPLARAGKVYLADLRQPTDFLPVYHPDSRRISFHTLPETKAGQRMYVYKGHLPKSGPYFYLFPQDPPGVIQWDTRSDSGTLFRFPYGARGPWSGYLADDEKTLWCPLWNDNGIARFDVEAGKWTGKWTPRAAAQLSSAGMIGDVCYAPDLSSPRVLRFGTVNESWLEPIGAPGHGTYFGILGGGFSYEQRMFCAMSTYTGYIPPGGPLGIDGKPHHFLDRWLCYDPSSHQFAHLVCRQAEGEYWITCYAAVLGRHLYITAFDAMQSDGVIRQGSRGEAAIFQTHPPGKPGQQPVWEDAPAVQSVSQE